MEGDFHGDLAAYAMLCFAGGENATDECSDGLAINASTAEGAPVCSMGFGKFI